MGRATRVQKHKRNSLEPDGQLPMRSGRALLYDAGSSTLGGDSERSVVTAANTYFAGFAATPPNEDEGSEITDKMNNLSLAAAIAPAVSAPRKNPRQSMVQRQKLHQAWLIRHPEHEQDLHSHSRIGRFGEDSNDEESPSNQAKGASVTDSDQNNSLLNDDSEVPTNNDCSETRTTTTASVHGDDVQKDGYCWRREDIYESTSILVASHASSSHADGSVSIGIVPPDQFRSRVPCDILTRWVFLLACLLTLWLSLEQLTWAEKHQQPNFGARRLVRGSSEVPSLRMTDEHQHLALPSSSSQPAAAANAIEGQDQGLVSGESIQWDSLTTGQMEQAVSFGFTKKKEFDSSSSSRQEPPPAPPANAEQPLQTATVSRPSPQPPTSETTEEPLPELTLGISEEEKEHVGSGQAAGAASSSAPSASPTVTPSSSNQALNEEPSTTTSNPAGEELEPTSVVQGTPPPHAESTSIPTEENDDQDEDKEDKTILVVFQINGVLVTKTMVLAFAASLCFTIVGITEWIQHDRLFQLSLAVAGVLGLLSAMVEVRHSLTSRMLHSLSVHWILAASVLILWARCQEASSSNLPPQHRSRRRAIHRTKEEALLLADVFFAVGALIAVFASYVSFGDDTAHLNIGVQAAGVCTAIMWVGCAVLYLCCSCSNSRYHELS